VKVVSIVTITTLANFLLLLEFLQGQESYGSIWTYICNGWKIGLGDNVRILCLS
jgi:hypothetical protein